MKIEKTTAGDQGVVEGMPERIVPNLKLKPQRAQTDAPLELECVDQKQGNLLEGK